MWRYKITTTIWTVETSLELRTKTFVLWHRFCSTIATTTTATTTTASSPPLRRSSRALFLRRPSPAAVALSAVVVVVPYMVEGGGFTAVPMTTLAEANTSIMNTIQNNNNNNLMTQESSFDINLWNGHNEQLFSAKDHPGYAMTSHPESHLGGWLAHRAVVVQGGMDHDNQDWIQKDVVPYLPQLDYTAMPIGRAPKILVLYGSLRESSYSRKLAYEFARLLEVLGCDVRVYHPFGLPMRNPDENGEQHVKVQEIRALTLWSDGHVWVSPEMHGATTGVFKNQIDWIPLHTGSVRPTQGKTCCVAQVNGGSQSFNAVNYLRLLARWMRMPCCTNQSSIPKAWQEFDDTIGGRMKPSEYRNRVVDVAEEFAKFTAVMVPVSDQLTDRYSERMEIITKGRLLSQAEKEKQKTIDEARKS
jgi:arsenical resistance protein ArsH